MGSRTATAPRSCLAHNAVYNICDYGADNTGVVDATAAIQAAIDAAPDYSTVLFPPGIYKVSGQPTLNARSGLVLFGPGAKLVLCGVGACGVLLRGALRDIVITGLHIVGSGLVGDDHLGIGTPVRPENAACTNIHVLDCSVASVVRGIYLNTATKGNYRDCVVANCRVVSAVGVGSGQGYGIVLSGVIGGSVTTCHTDVTQRHAIYVSACDSISVAGNTLRRNRTGVSDGDHAYGALAMGRGSAITAIGNIFDACEDSAVNIFPQESVGSGASNRGFVVSGNVFFESVHHDVWVGNSGGSASTDASLSDILITENVFLRPNRPADGRAPILVTDATRLTVARNHFVGERAYTTSVCVIELRGTSGAEHTQDAVIDGNTMAFTLGVGGVVIGVRVGAALCVGAQRITVRNTNLVVPAGTAQLISYDAARTNPHIRVEGNNLADAANTANVAGPDFIIGGRIRATGGFVQAVDGFTQRVVAKSQASVELRRANGRWRAPRAGVVTAVTVLSDGDVTTGALQLSVMKNTGKAGIAPGGLLSASLIPSLDANHPYKATVRQSYSESVVERATFDAGDELWLTIDTNAALAPASMLTVWGAFEVTF